MRRFAVLAVVVLGSTGQAAEIPRLGGSYLETPRRTVTAGYMMPGADGGPAVFVATAPMPIAPGIDHPGDYGPRVWQRPLLTQDSVTAFPAASGVVPVDYQDGVEFQPGGCAGGSCGHGHGGKWACFKKWLCYRETTVRAPTAHEPTPHQTPLYAYFPCKENPGCGPNGCAPGGHPGLGGAFHGGLGIGRGGLRTKEVAVPVSQANGGYIAGYRYALPESPKVTGRIPPPPSTSAYKVPLGNR